MKFISQLRRFGAAVLAFGLAAGALHAQEAGAPAAPNSATDNPAPAPTASPTQASVPALADPTALKPVEIRANRETEERRQSTAAKIVVGREEIERFGDSNERLPALA